MMHGVTADHPCSPSNSVAQVQAAPLGEANPCRGVWGAALIAVGTVKVVQVRDHMDTRSQT